MFVFYSLLDLVMSHNWFISLSFLVRIIESLGATAALIAAFSLTAACFPDSVATTFATLEVFYGLGYIFGPTLGSLLFDVSGASIISKDALLKMLIYSLSLFLK